MSMIKHFRHLYKWNQRDLWLHTILCVMGALFINTFSPNDVVKWLICGGLFVKICLNQRISNIIPSINTDAEHFSWKYLQSLPLSKSSLLIFLTLSYLFNNLAGIIWFLSFHKLIFTDFLQVEASLSAVTLMVVFAIIFIIFMALFTINNLIQFPRLQFVRKNSKILFYQSLRNTLIGMTAGIYICVLAIMFLEYFKIDLTFIGDLLKASRTASDWWLTPPILLFLWVKYRRVLKIWLREELSYKKINWKARRDIPVMLASVFILVFTFQIISTSHSSMYQGSQLLSAVAEKDMKLVTKLLEEGADINEANQFGFTALMVAAHEGNFEMFRFLESRGASRKGILKIPNDELHSGMNLFLTAIDGKNTQLVNYLLTTSENALTWNQEVGYSSVHLAAYTCNPQILDSLIERGVDVQVKNKSGQTPLHIAASQNCFASAVSLIEAGVDAKTKDEKGKLASDYVKKDKTRDFSYFLDKKSRAPASERK